MVVARALLTQHAAVASGSRAMVARRTIDCVMHVRTSRHAHGTKFDVAAVALRLGIVFTTATGAFNAL